MVSHMECTVMVMAELIGMWQQQMGLIIMQMEKQFIVIHVLVITKMKELLEQQMVAVTLHRVVLKIVVQITIIVIIIQIIIYKITFQKKWL